MSESKQPQIIYWNPNNSIVFPIEICDCGRTPKHAIDRRWVANTQGHCEGCNDNHGMWCTRNNFTLCSRTSVGGQK
jgi:hypothetical protein